MSRYASALQALLMQSTACMTFHTVQERCARWLLMTHDRVARDEFALTHEFLGFMVGARRPTVSLVLGALQQAGAIRTGTKSITIVDRANLETISCECYQAAKSAFERVVDQEGRDLAG